MVEERIQVLVVDDSALMRNLVGKIVDNENDLFTIGKAMNGEFALEKIDRLKPDVIVLDLEMPVMGGIDFLRERKERGIEIPVIILSSVAERGAKITMEALSLGAADFVTKPSGSVSHDIQTVGSQLVALLRGYGGRYRRQRGFSVQKPAPGPIAPSAETPDTRIPGGFAARHETGTESATGTPTISAPAGHTAPKRTPRSQPGPLEVIAIGISTGGPNALRKLLAELNEDIGVPIVVVQHMPAGFTAEFARSLDRVCALEVREAAEGDLMKPGRVLIAPGNYHVTVDKRSLAAIVHVHQQEPRNGHRPSADVLFESVAREFGNRAMGIIMTGMGRDGAQEIGSIYEAGGVTVGQDEMSSVVYGMPRVAFENGYLHRQVSLEEMSTVITETVAQYRR